jgi:hypothetical protein
VSGEAGLPDRAWHPLSNAKQAWANRPAADGQAVTEEAARVAAQHVPTVASVDETSASNVTTQTQLGVSDLSRLRRAACARRSRRPQQKALRGEFTSARRSDARKFW